jgi:outer membrane lipase/esterase
MLSIFGRTARLGTRAAAVTLSALILASCGGGDDAPTPPLFGTTVVFGASVTDTGNVCPAAPGCPPVPPYASGRYSNGPLYVETVAARYGAAVAPSTRGGTNYAYAGARTGAIPGLTTQSTTPSMLAQLDQFMGAQRGQLSNRSLFIIDATTFGNNITAGLPLIQATTITPTQLVTAGITDIVTMVTRLYAAGARHVVVVNAPNIGLTPLAQGIPGVGGPTGPAAQLSGGFAQNLAATLAQQSAGWPGLNLYQLDLFTLSNQITANPAAFGLSNVTAPCFSVSGTTVNLCAQPNQYLYWDSFHPTAAASSLIAQRINALLPAPQ